MKREHARLGENANRGAVFCVEGWGEGGLQTCYICGVFHFAVLWHISFWPLNLWPVACVEQAHMKNLPPDSM